MFEKRSSTEWVVFADSEVLSISPMQVLCELPVKDFKPDRMSLVGDVSGMSVSGQLQVRG